MPLEVEVKLEDSSVEASLETVPLRHLPLLVHNGECEVLVGHPCVEANCQSVSRTVRLQVKLRCLSPISQFGVEDVELVALDDLGRRVLAVVVRLVVLVPLVALLNTVEEAGLAHHEELLFALQHQVLIGASSVLRSHKVSKLLLISIHALLLGLLEHLDRRVVEAIVVDDVEPNTRVECCLLDFLRQTQPH